MYISRKQSMIVAVVLIALFLIVARLQMNSERPDTLPPVNEELSKELSAINSDSDTPVQSHFSLKDFHRAETKDGKKLWEVKAKEGTYIPEENAANITDATLFFYHKKRKPVKMTAPTSVIHLDGTSLSYAEMTGGVTIKAERNTILKTKKAIYNKKTEMITAPGKVHITSEMGKISGNQLSANVTTREIKILNNVKTTIVPGKKLKEVNNG